MFHFLSFTRKLRKHFFNFSIAVAAAANLLPAPSLMAQEEFELPPSRKVSQQVAVIGAATAGAVLGGVVGASWKGGHRHHSHSTPPGVSGPPGPPEPPGPQGPAGTNPPPLTGPASLTFTFTNPSCPSETGGAVFTPLIVKPDGTTLQGASMEVDGPAQSLIIPAPAQIGIYTIFILVDTVTNIECANAIVNAFSSTDPDLVATYYLIPFLTPVASGDQYSAEFIYSPAVAP